MPASKPIVILGSSRSDGDTRAVIRTVVKDQPIPIVDLAELDISYYDYASKNVRDDFIPLAEKMVEHDPIILATPVYWYTMSALMKTFIDRWTDLLDARKDLGRRLKKKEVYVIASYAGDMPRGFEDPFSQTCEYLGMHYKGCLYYYSGEKAERKAANSPLVERFVIQLFEQEKVIAQERLQ